MEEISSHLVRVFSPQKIILFGSCATGKADRHSDIDLLVITSFSGRRRQLMVEMDRAIASFKKPVDIIIQTADEYDKNRLIPGTIARYAFLEGKVLYDSHKH
ncbi:MAG: nucleotidyltransferase domain-containing protein [Candidatus Aminicenantes bacterium]|nr:nucleotidyltransferase domain-containing protein [Candidatus Aminicenantes bacterium]NIM81360.1 nucleotidyltransferase domain-containing protein [Candidatus Aminicenantes bacterium]NIN20771.1 nucleotidyltransferase domain-containing protein [Candidatus Aminicenantes bacterium]NIN44549.1 nucleotidyltransferase domain-containing protein [Candidatus Aminicenantes bacterium]NIN87369.1 nucleotidyltransferase domain-containing protein [Candidatus Aminicenantes bacterium]